MYVYVFGAVGATAANILYQIYTKNHSRHDQIGWGKTTHPQQGKNMGAATNFEKDTFILLSCPLSCFNIWIKYVTSHSNEKFEINDLI